MTSGSSTTPKVFFDAVASVLPTAIFSDPKPSALRCRSGHAVPHFSAGTSCFLGEKSFTSLTKRAEVARHKRRWCDFDGLTSIACSLQNVANKNPIHLYPSDIRG